MPILYPNQEDIKLRIEQTAGVKVYSPVELVDDTTNYMNVYRGQILRLVDREYFIMGDVAEPRFGMQDQPKYWVKKAVDMDTGRVKIIKCVFHEEFTAHIGAIRIPCFRSPEKEARVLELTHNDDRFMHGYSSKDARGNVVRVIDWIYGPNLYEIIMNLKIPHETYFHEQFPDILKNLVGCMEGIQHLHNYGLMHGDIRNDHIMVEQGTGAYRWIDFDLCQRFSDYDLWSMGNVIQFCSGMGRLSFAEVLASDRFSDDVKQSLRSEDGAAFLKYRIMNIGKLYKYIPERLNKVLMRFSIGTKTYYDRVQQMVDDLNEVLQADLGK